MNRIYKSFLKSKYHSTKYKKYFDVYDELFKKFVNRKITIVEIGTLNGGSLFMWREYFGNKAKIIGIDLNPKTKQLEKYGFKIFNGDQSNKNFWKKFFRTVGKVDIIIDDGGHTNIQQSLTTVYTVPHIKNGGMLLVEDTHSNYQKEFQNPSKYSFINFSKKIIDDVNYTFPLNIKKKPNFNYSLNDQIYSTHFYESIVVFHINRKKAVVNTTVENQGTHHGIEDLVKEGNELNIKKFKEFTEKISFISLRKITKYFRKITNNMIIKKFFD